MTQHHALIHLHSATPLVASWIVWDEKNEITEVAEAASLNDFPASAKHAAVTVIVPAEHTLLTHASLPKMSRHQLAQALPFALEEQLLSDVDDLHFAMGEYQALNNTLPVMIVSKIIMAEWLAALHECGISPNKMISASFALPYTPHDWYASISNTSCVIRSGKYQGCAGDQINTPELIALQCAAQQKPDILHIFNCSDKQHEINIPNISLNAINTIQITPLDLLKNADEWINTYPSINLLQGSYQAKQSLTQTKKIWHITAYLAAACIAFAFFAQLVSFFILHHEDSKLNDAINMLYLTHFPEAQSVVAPRERMESKLKKAQEMANNNAFLVYLAHAGKYLDKMHTIQLRGLTFRDNQLTLNVTSAAFTELDVFTKKMTQDGFLAKQQNAAISGTQVKSNIVIERGTS